MSDTPEPVEPDPTQPPVDPTRPQPTPDPDDPTQPTQPA